MRKKVILLDPDPLVTTGLREMLNSVPDYLLLANLKNFPALQLMVELREPDILIMELYDRDLDLAAGIHFIKTNRKRWASVRLIILSNIEEPGLVKYLLSLGVDYYLSKRDALADILHALQRVPQALPRISPRMNTLLMQPTRQRSALTLAELNVALLMAKNNTLSNISLKMNVSYKTIHTHKTNLMKKLNVSDLPQLVKYLSIQHQQF